MVEETPQTLGMTQDLVYVRIQTRQHHLLQSRSMTSTHVDQTDSSADRRTITIKTKRTLSVHTHCGQV